MKIALFINTDLYLCLFRLPLARGLRDAGHDVVLISPPGERREEIERSGFQWCPFPMSRSIFPPLREFSAVGRLTELYASVRPDVVHHFTFKCVCYGSAAARRAGVKTVVNTVTGLGYAFTGTALHRRLFRRLMMAAYARAFKGAKVVFQNPDDLCLFLRHRISSKAQSSIIPGSGVDVHKFVPSPEHGGVPAVVLPSRMLKDKGVHEFVGAARALRRSGVEARFILVGDSDPHNPASIPVSRLEGWQRDDNVEWHGWRDDMPAVYRGAAVVCLPSYREGLSRSLCEAAAAGRPIVTTDVPGCRDVVSDGVNGLLVPPQNVPELAEAVGRLLADPPMRRRMGAEGRSVAVSKFSMEIHVKKTLEKYSAPG